MAKANRNSTAEKTAREEPSVTPREVSSLPGFRSSATVVGARVEKDVGSSVEG